MKKTNISVFIVMMLSGLIIGATDEKFVQYEQTTVEPIHINDYRFANYFASPFTKRTFTYFERGLYINPYFMNLPEANLLPVEFEPTTFVKKEDYTFNFKEK